MSDSPNPAKKWGLADRADSDPAIAVPIVESVPPAPEKRETVAEAKAALKEEKARAAILPDPSTEKPHNLAPTEIRPVHRAVGRILQLAGMPLSEDERAALDEHGARFWSRWIKTSWHASAIAYGGTWVEIASSRVWESMQAASAAEKARKAANGTPGAPDDPVTTTPPADELPREAPRRE